MLSEPIPIGLLSSAPRTRELSHRAIQAYIIKKKRKRRSFLAPPYSFWPYSVLAHSFGLYRNEQECSQWYGPKGSAAGLHQEQQQQLVFSGGAALRSFSSRLSRLVGFTIDRAEQRLEQSVGTEPLSSEGRVQLQSRAVILIVYLQSSSTFLTIKHNI